MVVAALAYVACAAPAAAAEPFNATFSVASSDVSAGSHPTVTTTIATDPDSFAQSLQAAEISFPSGFWASDNGGNYCDLAFDGESYSCENDNAQIGTAKIFATIDFDSGPGFTLQDVDIDAKVYLERPQAGELARLVTITDLDPNTAQIAPIRLKPDSSGLIVDFADIPTGAKFAGQTFATHIYRIDTVLEGIQAASSSHPRPFVFNPTFCDPANGFHATIASYGPDGVASADDETVERHASYAVTGCAGLLFDPSLDVDLTSTVAGAHSSPASSFSLANGSATVAGLRLSIPSQLLLNPSTSFFPCPADKFAAATCDSPSQIGTAPTTTPLTDGELAGAIHLGPNDGGRIKVGIFFPPPYRFRIDGYLEKRADHGLDLAIELPPIPVTAVGLGLSSDVLLNPSQCQSLTATAKLSSHSGLQKTFAVPLTITGCSEKARNAPRLKAWLSTRKPNRFANLKLSVEQDPQALDRAAFILPRGFALLPRTAGRSARSPAGYIEVWDKEQKLRRGTLRIARRPRVKAATLVPANRQLKGLKVRLRPGRRRPRVILTGLPQAEITDFNLSIFGRHLRLLKTPRQRTARTCGTALVFNVDIDGDQGGRERATERLASACS